MTFCFALFLGLIHKNSRQFWDKSVYFNLFLPKLKKKKKLEQKEMPLSQMKRSFKDKVRTNRGKEKEIHQSINIEEASEIMCHSECATREQRGRPLC